jgi:hypothetical protein
MTFLNSFVCMSSTCALMVIVRVLLTGFGDKYWMVGHSILFIGVAYFFSKSALDTVLPLLSKSAKRATILAHISNDNDPLSHPIQDLQPEAERVAAMKVRQSMFAGQSDLAVLVIITAAFAGDIVTNYYLSSQAIQMINKVGVAPFYLMAYQPLHILIHLMI